MRCGRGCCRRGSRRVTRRGRRCRRRRRGQRDRAADVVLDDGDVRKRVLRRRSGLLRVRRLGVRVGDDRHAPARGRLHGLRRRSVLSCALLRLRQSRQRRDGVELRDAQEREADRRDGKRGQRRRACGKRRLPECGGDGADVGEPEHEEAEACPPVPDPPESQRGQPERLIRGNCRVRRRCVPLVSPFTRSPAACVAPWQRMTRFAIGRSAHWRFLDLRRGPNGPRPRRTQPVTCCRRAELALNPRLHRADAADSAVIRLDRGDLRFLRSGARRTPCCEREAPRDDGDVRAARLPQFRGQRRARRPGLREHPELRPERRLHDGRRVEPPQPYGHRGGLRVVRVDGIRLGGRGLRCGGRERRLCGCDLLLRAADPVRFRRRHSRECARELGSGRTGRADEDGEARREGGEPADLVGERDLVAGEREQEPPEARCHRWRLEARQAALQRAQRPLGVQKVGLELRVDLASCEVAIGLRRLRQLDLHVLLDRVDALDVRGRRIVLG